MRFSITNKNAGESLRVLFYEDDVDDIELALHTLHSAEFDVVSDVASTLEQFRDRVRSNTYDIILSDYNMPGNTGLDCLEVLKDEGLNVPLILVTGSLGDERAVECLKEGVADYVLKGGLARLPVAIRRALEEQTLKRQQEEAQRALRDSEASYRSLIQSAPCGILRVDAKDGCLLEVNGAMSEMLGYASPTDLLKDSVAGNIALDSNMLSRLTEESKDCGQIVGSDVEWKHVDGGRLTIHLRGRLLRDCTGAPNCFEMVAENLTRRRRAERQIAQLNRLYSVLSRAGQAIVQIEDRDQLFLEICRLVVEEGHFKMAWVGLRQIETGAVTRAASWGDETKYFETSRDEKPACGPVERAIAERRHIICNDVITDSHIEAWAQRAVASDYFSMAAFPLLVGGSAVGALAIYAASPDSFDRENVSLLDKLAANVSFALESIATNEKHQRAVDELNQFFALSLDMLCIADRRGFMYRLNSAWEKTLGFTAEELRNRPWVDFVHPEDRPQAIAAHNRLLASSTVESFEFRFQSKDGAYRWLMGSAAFVVERGNIFAAMTDITEIKLLETRLRNQNAELEEQNRRIETANRMKTEFLANMSHELRSPLNGIIGFTELLYDGKLGAITSKPKEYLGRIHKSAKHLLDLINGLLDLSKVEAGRIELQAEQVRLSELVQEVIGGLTPLAVEKDIRVETGVDAEVESAITDPGRFKQILYNYLSNALKFTNEGGTVQVKLKPDGPSEFRLEVVDTGIGIAADDVPRLFTEFLQLDASKAKRYQGTGLGLALTKRIVEAQGGRVGVESSLGKGSTFYAVLPRLGHASSLSPSILVVEDEKLQSFVLSKMLRDVGCQVKTAGTYAEAVKKCKEQYFDAITLDLVLPDGSGGQALTEIRAMKQYQKTPVIVVSMVADTDAGLPDDVQVFLHKPVDAKELAAALEQCGIAIRHERAA